MIKPTFLIFLLLSLTHSTHSRIVTENLISDGAADYRSKSPIVELNLTVTTVTCEPIYGFLPCTTELWGELFLIVVYEYLLSLADQYVAAGSELFFNMIGPGIFGASVFQVLGTIPVTVLMLGSRGSNVRLIEIAQGLKEGRGCIAMTLAETLMGLDAFHRWETTRFAGSPLLLQVWLIDKLQVVDSCSAYSARGYFFRQRLVDALDEGWWYNWMCSLSTDHIAWRCPWLNLLAMSYSMSWQTEIQLIGLMHYVFYFPFRFQRQFSHDQTCPAEGIEYPAAFLVQGV